MRKLMFVALAVLAVAGCGGQGSPKATATADDGGYSQAVKDYYGDADAHPETEAGTTEAVEAEYHQPPKPAQAGLGETITLTGTNIGVRLRVTVTGVKRVGDHQAVELALESTGITNYQGEFANAAVTYSDGKPRPLAKGANAPCSNTLDLPNVNIPVGSKTTGCLLFPASGSETPQRFQLALELVPTEAGGIWNLG
jgi:hypothetical protein